MRFEQWRRGGSGVALARDTCSSLQMDSLSAIHPSYRCKARQGNALIVCRILALYPHQHWQRRLGLDVSTVTITAGSLCVTWISSTFLHQELKGSTMIGMLGPCMPA